MELSKFIQQESRTDAETINLFDDIFDYHKAKKGETILQEGGYSKKVFFIEKGLTRIAYQKDGKDITHMFFSENMFYTPAETVFLGKTGMYNFEALSTCHIRVTDYATLEKYVDKHLELQKLMQYIMVSNIKMFSQQLHYMRFHSASERYKILLEEHPHILQLSPLGHIASYLGITQQTLSVIRSSMI